MRLCILILLFAFSLAGHAQDLLNKVGRAVKDRVGQAQDAAKAKGAETGAREKARLDSIDYQLMISVNENAGILDVDEQSSKENLYSLKAKSARTTIEVARDTLEHAITLYTRLRLLKMADLAFENAKYFMERNGLTNELVYLRCISTMAVVSLAQSKYQVAGEYIDWSLKNSARMLGENSIAYMANQNSRAKLYQQQGRYNEAEKEFDEALVRCEKSFTRQSLQYAVVLNNKAMLLQAIGRYDEAIVIMQEASTLAEETLKKQKVVRAKKSFENRQFLSNLAYIYQVSGRLSDAEKTYLEIKSVYENVMLVGQTNNPEYANLLNQMGILYITMGKTDKVEEYLKKSADIYKKKYSENHPSYARVTADLGNYYRMNGRYAEAEPLLMKALSIRESTLGTSHPDYVRSEEDVAILYWKTNRMENAYMKYREVMDKTIDFINLYFTPMSESEKTKYWDITAPRFQRFFNFAFEASATMPYVAQDFFDYQMATKAILLNSTNKVKQSILGSNDQQLRKDYVQWLDQKEQLARLYAYSKEELKEQKIDLGELERKANAMERSLSERSASFSSGYATQKISYKQLISLLSDTEAVVDIIRVRAFAQDFTTESRYVALILKKGMEFPTLVAMQNGNQMETRSVRFYRNAIQSQLDDEVSYEQYWGSLDPLLAGKKLIYLSPDGVYNQININTLRKPGGDVLVNRYDLVMLGNSKDLLALKAKKPAAPKKTAFLLGFPDYGTTEVSALPGTKVEVDGVARLLKASGYQLSQYMEKQATETNVKAIKAPALVHIATHGYFLADVEGSSNSVFGVNAENASGNPLLRSGLILAGAGNAISGTGKADMTSNDNGILTAYEAMNLNLEGTELVVLSACETGLGDVKSGEGVYGLQRAFLVAGADALIMSLWKVDDAATQQLMTNFYTNWLKTGNKQRAFKQAQLQLMTKYKEPYYWGAFVMMGM
jgi:CHAT domain-containing protein